MKGLFWNIRGLEKIGRVPALIGKIRDNHVDFVGVMETKRGILPHVFLGPSQAMLLLTWCTCQLQGQLGGSL